MNDAFTAGCLPNDDFQPLFARVPIDGLFEHVGAVEQDTAEGIVDFMGDAGGHAAQGREFFGLQDQMVITALLVFNQACLVQGARALFAERNDEVQFGLLEFPGFRQINTK